MSAYVCSISNQLLSITIKRVAAKVKKRKNKNSPWLSSVSLVLQIFVLRSRRSPSFGRNIYTRREQSNNYCLQCIILPIYTHTRSSLDRKGRFAKDYEFPKDISHIIIRLRQSGTDAFSRNSVAFKVHLRSTNGFSKRKQLMTMFKKKKIKQTRLI